MKIILGSLCFALALACSQEGSHPAGSGSGGNTTPAAASSASGQASAIVSRANSTLITAQTDQITCSEKSESAEMRLNFPSASLSLYFRFNGSSLVVGTFDLKIPSSAFYFDGEFAGRTLTWGPELPGCSLVLSRSGDVLKGQFDCFRNQNLSSSFSDVLQIVAHFQCRVSK